MTDDWTVSGVHFPQGTEFRAEFKGIEYTGKVSSGALVVAGKRFNSPSAAAVEVTKRSTNGWNFWKCRLPGGTDWVPIRQLRNLRGI